MRVLLYAAVFADEEGGVQQVFNRLAGHLRAEGHSVAKAWALGTPPRGSGDLACPLPPLVWRDGLPAPRSAFEASRAMLRLGSRLLSHRPSVVNCHFVTAEARYFLWLKRLLGFKVVLSVHGSDVLRPQASSEALLPDILRSAEAVTAVSAITADRVSDLAGIDRARVRVIPNGIDHAFWSAAGGAPLAARPPVVLTVGRLQPVKGQDLLLAGFAGVRERVPAARLVVVGGGGFGRVLERQAADLGIASSVEFTGEVEPEEVRRRMAEARVFVLPSRSEGLPLALLEAMAAGLPCVATRVGGVPEVVEEGTGVLVPPEDRERLVDAVAGLLVSRDVDEMARRATERSARFLAADAQAAYGRVLREVADR